MPSVVTLDSVVRVSNSSISARLGNEVVIVELGSGQYFSLDGVGPAIWTMLQQPIGVTALRDAIVRDYTVDRVTCESDLLAILRELAEQKIIDVLPESQS